jgi:Casein kinase II regulatory subunit
LYQLVKLLSSSSDGGHIKRMSTSSGTPESWISSFCSLLGHEYFAEISEDFIEDDFNLTGLQSQVAMYKEALEVTQNSSLGYVA